MPLGLSFNQYGLYPCVSFWSPSLSRDLVISQLVGLMTCYVPIRISSLGKSLTISMKQRADRLLLRIYFAPYGRTNDMVEKMCIESQRQESLEFVDISTLEKRLLGKNNISHEFIDKKSGWCRSRFIPVDYDENGRLLHVLFCIECIEEEKKRENWLIYLAKTDLMTGLCNRGSGEKRITELLKEKTKGLLCLIDCDKFKSINDTYGHSVGDKAIIAVAKTLQKTCRDSDVVMRLGGDEFAIFMPKMLEQTVAEKFFERLFENIRQIDIIEMRGKSIEISLGACFYDGYEDVSFDQLYRKADRAMYQSKKQKGCSAVIYGEGM